MHAGLGEAAGREGRSVGPGVREEDRGVEKNVTSRKEPEAKAAV